MESSALALKARMARPAGGAGRAASERASAHGPNPKNSVSEVDTNRNSGDDAVQADGMPGDVMGRKASGPHDTRAAAGGVRHGDSAHGNYIVLQLRDTAQGAQITLDTIQTMLALLERVAPEAVRVLGNVMPAFKVACYKRKAEELAEQEPLFAAIQSVARVRNGTLSAKMQVCTRCCLRGVNKHVLWVAPHGVDASVSYSLSYSSDIYHKQLPRHRYLPHDMCAAQLSYCLPVLRVHRMWRALHTWHQMQWRISCRGLQPKVRCTWRERGTFLSRCGWTLRQACGKASQTRPNLGGKPWRLVA